MARSAFTREVAALSLGKRLPDGVYVHVEALGPDAEAARDLDAALTRLGRPVKRAR